jgi:hypothetical protein
MEITIGLGFDDWAIYKCGQEFLIGHIFLNVCKPWTFCGSALLTQGPSCRPEENVTTILRAIKSPPWDRDRQCLWQLDMQDTSTDSAIRLSTDF